MTGRSRGQTHIVVRASSDLVKSLVMLNMENRVKIQRERENPVALNLQHTKTVFTSAVSQSENTDGESTWECS